MEAWSCPFCPVRLNSVYDLVHHYELSHTPRFKCPYDSCSFIRDNSFPEMVVNHIIRSHIAPQYSRAKLKDQWQRRFVNNSRKRPTEFSDIDLHENMMVASKKFYASQSPIKSNDTNLNYSPLSSATSDSKSVGNASPCDLMSPSAKSDTSSWREQSPGQTNWTPSDIMGREEARLWDMRLTASDIKHVVHVPSKYPPMAQPEEQQAQPEAQPQPEEDKEQPEVQPQPEEEQEQQEVQPQPQEQQPQPEEEQEQQEVQPQPQEQQPQPAHNLWRAW
ncbi:unnamed protein product [Owenia fusiformis]|uniref:C2H2-type domain-containing protein n=1 Tax=Owenia fusiformis TaxID=6347 RepID=A0A8S4NQ54_OWEFU|nr:unnamed protein product [Owenia fusiformis]